MFSPMSVLLLIVIINAITMPIAMVNLALISSYSIAVICVHEKHELQSAEAVHVNDSIRDKIRFL